MNNQNLIQLIRESIQNYISEIDHAGENAACEAKINAIGDAITTREKKMNMEGIDEAYHDMIDKSKMKELASEIKVLKKSLTKYQKQLEKLKSKGNSKIEKVEDTEKEEIIDETSLNENSPIGGGSFFDQEDLNDAWREIEDEVMEDLGYNDEDLKDSNADNKLYKITSDRFLTKYGKTFSDFAQNLPSKDLGDFDYDTRDQEIDPAGGYGPRSHMEEDMNIYEVLHMQKLAGIITEEQYNEAVQNPTLEKSNSLNIGGVAVPANDLNVDAIMTMIKTKSSNAKNIDTASELVKLFDALLTYIKEITKDEASKAEIIASLEALIKKHKLTTK